MEKYLNELIKEVGGANPGAFTVIRELQWFSRWEKMLEYFKEIGLVGGKLWARVADDYHHDFHAFGTAIDREMYEFYLEKNPPTKLKGKIVPFTAY